MALDEIRAERMKKLALLREKGIDPYPIATNRTHTIADALAAFDGLEASAERVAIAGRIMSRRGQGGIIFVDLFDGTETMQALIRRDDIGDEQFDLFNDTVDSSDFIEVTGTALTTKRGEKSIAATAWRMLSKSMVPVPSEWFGLKDEDARLRKRYLDILLNKDVAMRIAQRSKFWNAVRSFMLARNFIEVETPVLETTPGGADARPFVTHHNALDIDVFLRISGGELWQKRLMVAGIPKTFEIGRIFRNEGISHEHAQDYTQFEFYEAYADASTGIPMLQELYRYIAQEVFGTTTFTYNGHTFDLSAEWNQANYCSLIQSAYGFDPRTVTLDQVIAALAREGFPHEEGMSIPRGVDMLWKKIRKSIAGPAILTGMPVYLEPLAKLTPNDARTVERYQILIAGTELGKAFNELNDPVDQAARLTLQQQLRDAGDDEAQMNDADYVEAMEYGMPPCFGFGVSERLFSYLSGVPIREAQIFPLMRPKQAE